MSNSRLTGGETVEINVMTSGNLTDQGKEDLSENAKELRRLYHREYQRRNKDKVKQYTSRYWEKKARQAAASGGKVAE